MNSCIYIDGVALWAVVILAAILFIGFIYFGNCYGGPRQRVRKEKLDELFRPVLPLHAVQVKLEDYLV